MIAYSHAAGLAASIVTNGSLLTLERIRSWQGKVSCIGLSIDSVEPETNRSIGRCQRESTISLSRLIELAEVIHECGISLKINTVVSGLNLRESLAPLYRAVKPEKIKLFQMHLVGGINDHAAAYAITEEQYCSFVCRHKASGLVIVEEPAGSMENSYLMVNPEGCFQLNDNGVYHTYGNLRAEALTQILKRMPLDGMRYESRYAREDNG